MKNYVLLFLVALLALALGAPEEKYTDKYDNVNVDEIIGNRVLLVNYVKCGLDQIKCTPEGKELKSHIKDALETKCEKCTERQRTETRRVIKHLINEEPEFWEQLSDKYDPDRKYSTLYEKELKEVKG